MKRLRHDLNHLVSAALLVVALAAILTGVVAHLWDLNDFRYHTWAGYAMTGFALAHVWLNWGRLTSYARFRFRRRSPATTRRAVITPPVPTRPAEVVRGALLSRRGVVGGTLGLAVGLVGGRGLRQPPVIPHGSDVGVVYHEWSKPGVLDALGSVADWGEQPAKYKTYPRAARTALVGEPQAGLATEQAIMQRRSTREFSRAPLSSEQLSQLLRLTGGRSGERWGNRLRTAPSSGALYPIELYPVVLNVDGVDPGVHHYAVADHTLELVRSGDLRGAVVQHGLLQDWLGDAGVVLYLTVIFQRMRFKYRDRTYRYGLIEAGHLGQNIYLAATSMGLGACAVGAFMDDRVNAMLGVDGREEAAVYMVAVGSRAV